MEDQEMGKVPAEPEHGMGQSSYKVISYSGKSLPTQYVCMIYARWLRSLRHGNDYFKLIDSDCYYSSYAKYIGTVLSSLLTTVRLAVLSDDNDIVIGFSVETHGKLEYVHVHKDCRRQGVATSLVPFEVKYITHVTKTGLVIWNSKLPDAKFNPFY